MTITELKETVHLFVQGWFIGLFLPDSHRVLFRGNTGCTVFPTHVKYPPAVGAVHHRFACGLIPLLAVSANSCRHKDGDAITAPYRVLELIRHCPRP